MAKPDRYTARIPRNPLPVSADENDFLRRRTEPFLDSAGRDRPLSIVLKEVYLQGIRDTLDAQGQLP